MESFFEEINSAHNFSENLKISRENFGENPDARFYQKLLQNSTLGKFGQVNIRKSLHYCTNQDEIEELLFDKTKEVVMADLINSDIVQITTKPRYKLLSSTLGKN